MENNNDTQDLYHWSIIQTDRDNQQESFINDQIIKDHKHEPSEDIEADSEDLAAKRSKKISDIADDDKDETEVMDDDKKDDQPDQDGSETGSKRPWNIHI
jgi:hypothetical protein